MREQIIYLNNAATSWPKPRQVVDKLMWAVRELPATPGRGGAGLQAERAIFQTREAVADFIGAEDSARVVFTANATAALNQAIIGALRGGEEVVTTSVDHNSVARPLARASQRMGVKVTRVQADGQGRIDAGQVLDAVTAATRLVVLTHASNVTGTIQPVEEVGRKLKEHNPDALLLVDAAQTAGVLPITVRSNGIDLLAAPGHKSLYGPQGTGFLYAAPGVELDPLLEGGTGGHSTLERQPESMPEKLESGTPNTPGIVALGAAVNFVREKGIEQIRAHESQLIAHLRQGLAQLPGLVLYGPEDPGETVGVLSFNVQGLDPAEVGTYLAEVHGIGLRVGLHCSPLSHRTIGSFPAGTVRVGPGVFNTLSEMDRLLAGVADLLRMKGVLA